MCTLLIAYQAYSDCPLFLATNRDEFLNRPAGGFRYWPQANGGFVAPMDKQAGGTWLGVNTHGIAAAITNRYGNPPDPARRSRGELVPMALNEVTVESSVERLCSLAPGDYNPFHLLVVSTTQGAVVWSDGQTLNHERLQRGFTVITEQSYGAADGGREVHLRKALAQNPSRETLAQLLRTSAVAGAGARVSIPEMNYGTRSSTLIKWPVHGLPRIQHTSAPPDTSQYSEFDWSMLEFESAQRLNEA